MNGKLNTNEVILKGTVASSKCLIGHIAPSRNLLASINNKAFALLGKIDSNKVLNGSIRPIENLNGSIFLNVDYEDYKGSYDIVPQIEEQILETNDKHLNKDLKVHAIPYYSVSNEYNGVTIIIGGHDYG